MSNTLLQQEPMVVETEPFACNADLIAPLGNRAGSVRIEIDREGFRLIFKKRKHKEYANIRWGDLRELKNEVRETGRFSFFGTVRPTASAVAKAKIRVQLDAGEEERQKLAAVLDQLPEDVAGRQCPGCNGPVGPDGLCKSCGKSRSAQLRTKGLIRIVIGAVILGVGIALTTNSYNASTGKVTVYFGVIIIGALLAIFGLIGLIFAVRTD